MDKFWNVLKQITAVLCVVSLTLLLGTVIVAAWQAWQNRGWKDTILANVSAKAQAEAQNTPPKDGDPKPPQMTAEQKLQLQATVADTQAKLIQEIRAYDTDERAILDRLITLVGIYSAVLGLTTFFTVKLAREDARADLTTFKNTMQGELTTFKTNAQTELGTFKTTTQSDLTNFQTTQKTDLGTFRTTTQADISNFKTTVQTDLATFKSATTADLTIFKNNTLTEMAGMKTASEANLQSSREATRQGLETLTRTTTAQIEEFRQKIWSELPEMRNLKESLRDLLFELERTIPSESNWNSERSYESLNENERQSVLVTEATVNALQIFVAKSSTTNIETQARLYRSLAGFYLGRFRVDKHDPDVERAEVYARRSQEIEPENSGTYRLRGALHLAKYRILKQSCPEPHTDKMKEDLKKLLSNAEGYLNIARGKNKKDAGAAYNLALVASYRKGFDDAIAISKETIQQGAANELTPIHVRKYLPDVYVNLACYLARKADELSDAAVQQSLRDEAVQSFKDGLNFFETKGLADGKQGIRAGIVRERGNAEGALKNLTAAQKAELDAL